MADISEETSLRDVLDFLTEILEFGWSSSLGTKPE